MSGRRRRGMRRNRKLCQSFYEYEPPKVIGRCNVLLFGPSGSGKSSIANTCMSDLDDVCEKAPIRVGSLGQCTVTYDKYVFHRGRKVSILDPWGHSEAVYDEQVFRTMLAGGVKAGHKMEEVVVDRGYQDNDQIIDGVIFVVAADEAYAKKDCVIDIKKYYHIAKESNIPVFIAVTKMDVFMKEVEKCKILQERDPSYAARLVSTSEAWKDLIKRIKGYVGDTDASILPIINYQHGETFTSDVIHFLAQRFVQNITGKIDDYYNKHYLPSPGPDGPGPGPGPFPDVDAPRRMIAPKRFRGERPLNTNFMDKSFEEELNTSTQSAEVSPKFIVLDSYYCLLQLGKQGDSPSYDDFWRFFHLEVRSSGGDIKITGLFHPDKDEGKSAYFEHVSTSEQDGLTCGLMVQTFGDQKVERMRQARVHQYTFCSKKGDLVLSDYSEGLTQHVKIFLSRNRSVVLTKIDDENIKWNRNHSRVLNIIRQEKQQDEKVKMMAQSIQKKDRPSNEASSKPNTAKLEASLEVMKDKYINLQKSHDDLITFVEKVANQIHFNQSLDGGGGMHDAQGSDGGFSMPLDPQQPAQQIYQHLDDDQNVEEVGKYSGM